MLSAVCAGLLGCSSTMNLQEAILIFLSCRDSLLLSHSERKEIMVLTMDRDLQAHRSAAGLCACCVHRHYFRC